jgi:cholesterol transport system auxiliary component
VNLIIKRLAVLPLIGAAACSGSFFQSKGVPPTIYVLSPGASAAAADAPAAVMPVDLAVLKPTLRTGLDSDRIAVLYPDRRLDHFADAGWTGPLGDVLQELAIQEFQARAHLRTVSGDTSVFTSAYWLEIEVMDFQAEYTQASAAPTVHVRLLARVGGSADRVIIGRFEADVRRPAAENRLGAIVDAYARAADTAFADIVAGADASLAKASEAR